jgi:hypothetical protein
MKNLLKIGIIICIIGLIALFVISKNEPIPSECTNFESMHELEIPCNKQETK